MNNIVLKRDIVLDKLEYDSYDIVKSKVVINLDKKGISNSIFNLDEDSYLIINKKYNEKDIDEVITINLNGINSRVDYNFSSLCKYDQKYVININHNNKYTISNVINHGVVLNDSKLVFEVNSTVKKGNSNSILNQESKIIVMSKNNSIIKPNLFIDEYDVEARHAATIGRFSNDDIFYLMSKGINKEDSINLLIDGFLNIGR